MLASESPAQRQTPHVRADHASACCRVCADHPCSHLLQDVQLLLCEDHGQGRTSTSRAYSARKVWRQHATVPTCVPGVRARSSARWSARPRAQIAHRVAVSCAALVRRNDLTGLLWRVLSCVARCVCSMSNKRAAASVCATPREPCGRRCHTSLARYFKIQCYCYLPNSPCVMGYLKGRGCEKPTSMYMQHGSSQLPRAARAHA